MSFLEEFTGVLIFSLISAGFGWVIFSMIYPDKEKRAAVLKKHFNNDYSDIIPDSIGTLLYYVVALILVIGWLFMIGNLIWDGISYLFNKFLFSVFN